MYHPFAHLIADNGRELSRTSMICRDGRYELDFQDLEKKLADSRASLLIFCSPHNPSGRVFTRSELEQVIRLCHRHQVLLLLRRDSQRLLLFGPSLCKRRASGRGRWDQNTSRT